MKTKCVVIGIRKPDELNDLSSMKPFLVHKVNGKNGIFVGDFDEAVGIAAYMSSNFEHTNYEVYQKVGDDGEPVFDMDPIAVDKPTTLH